MPTCPFRQKIQHLLAGGEISGEAASELLATHREAECATCDAARRRPERVASGNLLAFPDPAGRGRAIVLRQQGNRREEIERDLEALAAVSADERAEAALRGRERLRTLDFVERALGAARAEFLHDARQARGWAKAAEALLLRLHFSPAERSRALAAGVRSMIYQANARRILGDYVEADRGLAQSLRLVRRERIEDPLLAAEIDGFRGSLRRGQGRIEESARLYERAARRHLLAGRGEEAARIFVALGMTHSHGGDPAAALAQLRRARDLVGSPDVALQLLLRHNEVHFLFELGRFAEAESLLERQRHLYSSQGTPTILRGEWLLAEILQGSGNAAAALPILEHVYRSFAEIQYPGDAAVAALAVARIAIELERPERALRATHEALSIVERLGLERHVDEALELRHQASLLGS